jgi:hypothetical protein
MNIAREHIHIPREFSHICLPQVHSSSLAGKDETTREDCTRPPWGRKKLNIACRGANSPYNNAYHHVVFSDPLHVGLGHSTLDSHHGYSPHHQLIYKGMNGGGASTAGRGFHGGNNGDASSSGSSYKHSDSHCTMLLQPQPGPGIPLAHHVGHASLARRTQPGADFHAVDHWSIGKKDLGKRCSWKFAAIFFILLSVILVSALAYTTG